MSPLEQFEIIPILQIPFLVFTNSTLILVLTFFFFFSYIKMFQKGFLIPTRWQIFFESLYDTAF